MNTQNFEILFKYDIYEGQHTRPFPNHYTAIISHGDADGIVSAALMSKTLSRLYQPHMVIISMDPTQAMTDAMLTEALRNAPFGITHYNIIVCDRDLASPFIIAHNQVHNVVWCDHHKTSIEKFEAVKDSYNTLALKTFLTKDPTESAATVVMRASYQILCNDILEFGYDIKLKPTNIDYLFTPMQRWAKITALWDTFTWKKGPNEEAHITELDIEKATTLSKASYVLPARMLFDLVVREEFEDCYSNLKFAASIYQFRLDKAIEEAIEKSQRFNLFRDADVDGTVIGGLVTKDVPSQYISLFADHIFETMKDVQYVVVISNGLVSTRVQQSCSLDTSAIMKEVGSICGFSGGGHPKAAGCKYKEIPAPVSNETSNEDIFFVMSKITNAIADFTGYHCIGMDWGKEYRKFIGDDK